MKNHDETATSTFASLVSTKYAHCEVFDITMSYCSAPLRNSLQCNNGNIGIMRQNFYSQSQHSAFWDKNNTLRAIDVWI